MCVYACGNSYVSYSLNSLKEAMLLSLIFIINGPVMLLLPEFAQTLIFQSSANPSDHMSELGDTGNHPPPAVPFKCSLLGSAGTTRATGSHWTPGAARPHWNSRRERDERCQWPTWSSGGQGWQGKLLFQWEICMHQPPALLCQLLFPCLFLWSPAGGHTTGTVPVCVITTSSTYLHLTTN